MAYEGPNRRIHTVFRTKNREYHVRAGVCVAVQDLKTQVWISNHEAIGMELELNVPYSHYLGRPLVFLSPRAGVKTTHVRETFRPEKNTVDFYHFVGSFCHA